jgi:hypothetical protein
MRIRGTRAYSSPFFYRSIPVCTLMCSTNPAGSLSSRLPFSSGGGLAQLGEHYVRNVGVAGSTPVPSTTVINRYAGHQ